MTHVSLHRCRFVDYPPSSITSIAFSHSSVPHSVLPPPKTLRVAIGRNNGSIEIWNPLSGKWHHESTLQGGKDRSIEGLAWTQDYDPNGHGQLRLLSIGYSSVVTEWDLATGRPAKHLDCNGGVIWSISTQPRRNSADVPEDERDDDEALAQSVVVGTDDGTLKLLSTAGGKGQLAFVKNLIRAGTSKARVLSLTWKDRHTVVAGMADSTIRVWDTRSGRNIARMSLNRERGKEVLVWAVKVTKHGDIVSGDSRGEVCFWNGTNWTLKQRMKAHDADCLTLEIGGHNSESVISGGADMRTILFRIAGKGRGWGEVGRRRFHKHDVRAMAAYESGAFSVVVSGGVDMTPIIIPFRGFTTENHRTLPLVPQNAIVTTIPEKRLLMSYWEREVKVWKIEELSEAIPADLNLDDEDQGRKLLSRIILSNEEYITSADLAILPNNAGYLLAVATIGEVKLFCLRHPKRRSEVLRVQRIVIPGPLPIKNFDSENDSEDSDDEEDIELAEEGARQLKFTPDGKQLLVITPDSKILIANLEISISEDRKGKPNVTVSSPVYQLDRSIPSPSSQQLVQQTKGQVASKKKSRQKQDNGTHGTYINTIVKVAFSTTSRLLAVGDLAGNITTFTLSPAGTWSRTITSVPRFPVAPAVLSFRPIPTTISPPSPPSPPSSEDDEAPDADLLILPADTHTVHLFSVTSGRFTPWSQRNPMPDCLPVEFAAVADRAIAAFWEGSDRVWCYGAAWVWMFDFSRDWPDHRLAFDTRASEKRKRGAPVGVGSISGAGSRMTHAMGLVTASAAVASDSGEESDGREQEYIEEQEDEEGEEGEEKNMRMRKGQKPYWGSFRYRSLLGFLPVGKREVVEMGWGEGGLGTVEMVVVERPVWDVGLPPRFYDGRS